MYLISGYKSEVVNMEYEIIGDNLQMVVTKLSSGEVVYGEAGAMIYMSDNMQMNAKTQKVVF
ncbi:hypothetical protein C5S32_06200 [ANME-1 cluster archaeon GoMg1]|nr:hypothetical protein [ANME-1 cluster archaeon GoMg1]